MSIPSLNCPRAITALEQVYGKVSVLDPYRGTVLDPATLQPTDKAEELTALDETGRGVLAQKADDGGRSWCCTRASRRTRPPLRVGFPLLHAPQSAMPNGAENSNRVLARCRRSCAAIT